MGVAYMEIIITVLIKSLFVVMPYVSITLLNVGFMPMRLKMYDAANYTVAKMFCPFCTLYAWWVAVVRAGSGWVQ